MKISEIESGIPVPVKEKKDKYELLRKQLDRMQEKHSIVITIDPETDTKINFAGIKSAITRHCVDKEIKFLCKQINETSMRIWRIK